MTITLYNMTSPEEKIGKTMTAVLTMTGSLRNESGRTRPSILIEADIGDLSNVNYMRIEEFDRYYFVSEIESIRSGACRISGRVDVLESFKDSILNETVILKRQRNNWNLYINDGSLIAYENDKMYTVNFPTGITGKSFMLVTI